MLFQVGRSFHNDLLAEKRLLGSARWCGTLALFGLRLFSFTRLLDWSSLRFRLRLFHLCFFIERRNWLRVLLFLLCS